MQSPMRLLICEQYTLFREGIKAVLLTHPSIEVVGTAADGRQAIERTLGLRPDVVLMDISMNFLGGFSGVDFITRTDKSVKILVFTDEEEEGIIEQCLNSGASGYVRKDTTSEQLIEAFQTVFEGGTYFKPRPERFCKACSLNHSIAVSADLEKAKDRTLLTKPKDYIFPSNLFEFPNSN